jgi:hypothetical protein
MDYDRDQLMEGFDFLDKMRATGRYNMIGASGLLQHHLCYERVEARNVAAKWMETFDGESTVEQRVEKVMAEG